MSERGKRAAEADLEDAPASKQREKDDPPIKGRAFRIYGGEILDRPTGPIVTCEELLWLCAFNTLVTHFGREYLLVAPVFAETDLCEYLESGLVFPVWIDLHGCQEYAIRAYLPPGRYPFKACDLRATWIARNRVRYRDFRTFTVDGTLRELFEAAKEKFYRDVALKISRLAAILHTWRLLGRAWGLADLLSDRAAMDAMQETMKDAFWFHRRPSGNEGWGDPVFVLCDAVVTMADGEQLCFPRVTHGNLGELFGELLVETGKEENEDSSIFVMDGDLRHVISLK